MTSSLAQNSRKETDALKGFPLYLEASYVSPGYPLEKQIPLTATTTANATGTYSGIPDSNIWICNDVLTAGDATYALTAVQAMNMAGRETVLSFSGTPAVGNSVNIQLPAGWEWVAAGVAAGNQNVASPANVRFVMHIYWTTSKQAIIVSDPTGYTFS